MSMFSLLESIQDGIHYVAPLENQDKIVKNSDAVSFIMNVQYLCWIGLSLK